MGSTIQISAGATATQIQAAIDGAPAGSTIKLAAGNYSFDRTVTIDRDDVSIVGAGAGKTVIAVTAGMKGAPAFRVGQELFNEQMQNSVQIADAKAGETEITVTNGSHALKAGDAIWIERENDKALFDAIGDTKWREDKPLRTGMAIVKSVDGNKITLDRPLPFDFTQSGTTVSEIDLAKGVVLKGFTLKGAYGAANPAKFSNTISTEKGAIMLVINTSDGVVLNDIDVLNAGSNGVVFAKTIDAKVSDILVNGAQNKGDAGNGYAFWIRDVYNSDFSGLQAFDTRHAVLFASYTSAVGNTIQVDKTNRDINFHGGLDHDNTVIVDWSVRSPVEQSYLGGVTFVNPGTDYGAPTDPDANIIRFKKVVGSVRDDIVYAVQTGADIATMDGPDWISGGRGHDRLDGGAGNDTIIASAGRDTVLGGQGSDTLMMEAKRSEVRFVKEGSQIGIVGAQGVTWITGIELLRLSDATLKDADMLKAATGTALRPGKAGFDWITTSQNMTAGEQLNGIHLTGNRGVTVIGNALANHVTGSSGADVVALLDGRDTASGADGADVLSGGGGDDRLLGGAGNDLLDGGIGNDRLTGGMGADRFQAGHGQDVVTDFSFAEGDQFLFRGTTTSTIVAALSSWVAGDTVPDGFSFAMVKIDGVQGLSITDETDQNLVLLNITAAQVLDYYM